MGDNFWWNVAGTVLGGVIVLLVGAKYFGQGSFTGFGGGGPQNAGARPVQNYPVYPDTQSQPAWAFPDPASDTYNAGTVTSNDAGRAGTQDNFGQPLGRRTDNNPRGVTV